MDFSAIVTEGIAGRGVFSNSGLLSLLQPSNEMTGQDKDCKQDDYILHCVVY
jgi:hypothetical protein